MRTVITMKYVLLDAPLFFELDKVKSKKEIKELIALNIKD